jgi:hypothetical protein
MPQNKNKSVEFSDETGTHCPRLVELAKKLHRAGEPFEVALGWAKLKSSTPYDKNDFGPCTSA